mgnify:CR=1 FL=1
MKIVHAMVATAAVVAVGCGDAGYVSTGVEAASVQANPNPGVAPIGSRPYGYSYGEWEARWWQWASRIPVERNPILDSTGEHCAEGQDGPVWFLAGNYGGVTRRECTVPAGKSLFFPLINGVWWQTLQDAPHTVEAMREEARGFLGTPTLAATVDGRSVLTPARYYEETPVFTSYFPTNNAMGFDATWLPVEDGMLRCDQTVDAGYALMLHPLSAGDHTVRFTARAGWGELDVTYTLHVR